MEAVGIWLAALGLGDLVAGASGEIGSRTRALDLYATSRSWPVPTS